MANNKFILIENFTWLVDRLKAFVDPNIQYTSVGRPDLKGGSRRIYRKDNHFEKYSINDIGTVTVNLGSTKIECDKFSYEHEYFKDAELKEKYKTNKYTVMVTSRASMKAQTAPRYWVHCSCDDFAFTFLEKLVQYGYTSDTGAIPPSTNVKATDPTICKHLYDVIVEQHKEAFAKEGGVAIQPADVMPWNLTPSTPTAPQQPIVAPNAKKAEYAKLIAATLKRLNNASSTSIQAYKAPGDSAKHYRKYKFMVKWYGKGWAIVFTNPSSNPFPDVSQYKEMVPIYDRTATGMKPSPLSPLAVYANFTKDELKELIRNNTKEIQPAQVTRLKSILGIKPSTPDSSWLTENLELSASIVSSIREVL